MKVINLNPLLLDHSLISAKIEEWKKEDAALLEEANAFEDEETRKLKLDAIEALKDSRPHLDTFTRFEFSLDTKFAQVFDMGQQAGNKIYRVEFIQNAKLPGAQVEWPWAMVQLEAVESLDRDKVIAFASEAIFSAREEELNLRKLNEAKRIS